MKAILFLILFILGGTECFSQNENFFMKGELSKYWFYRWRLRNDFMVMGSEQGQSLLIDTRNPEAKNLIKWGDATILHGYYLTMLATEHRILQPLGRFEDLKNNELELYYAIKAYERLDYNSETFYSSDPDPNKDVPWDVNDTPLPGSVNGYVYRDDVPPTFISNNPAGGSLNDPTDNYYKLNNGKTGVKYGHTFYNTGDYEDLWKPCEYEMEDENNYLVAPVLSNPHLPIVDHLKGRDEKCYGIAEESQDQMIRLLLGFQMIVWSIPNVNVGIDLDNNGTTDAYMNFSKEARRHATNLIGRAAGYFKGTFQFGVNTNMYWPAWSQFLGTSSFWTIRGPRHQATSLGAGITYYLPPMQRVSQLLYTPNNDLGITTPLYAKAGFNNYLTDTWQTAWNTGLFGYGGAGNAKMTILMNILSNTGNMPLHTMGRHIYEKSKGNLGDEEKDYRWHPFYVPQYDYIWGWNPSGNANKERKKECFDMAKFMMHLAPCIGPYNFWMDPTNNGTTDQLAPNGFPPFWKTPMLWDHGAKEWSGSYQEHHITTGFFNGVDYMILYNLIYANSTESRPLYHDLINRIVDYQFHSDYPGNLTEYSGSGLLIGAFENMKLRSNVTGSNPLEFKALEFVQLESGAFINPLNGGSVLIYTDTIKCTPGTQTNWDTPYKSAPCETCGLDEVVGTSFAPKYKKPIKSFRDELDLEYLYDYNINRGGFSEEPGLNIVVYPNPTSDKFRILGVDVAKIENIRLLTIMGQPVKELDKTAVEHSIQELSNGVYWVEVITINKERYVVEIVKN